MAETDVTKGLEEAQQQLREQFVRLCDEDRQPEASDAYDCTVVARFQKARGFCVLVQMTISVDF